MIHSLVIKGGLAGIFGSLLVSTAISTSPVYAEDGVEGITLSPVSKRYELDAGATRQDSFKIINDGTIAYDFIVYARPYTIVDSDYNNPNYGDAASNTVNADAYKWVTFEKTKYHLNPGESVDVNYTLEVSQNAAPGGHYGVLFAETQSGGDEMIGRNKRVGSVVYATVKGDFAVGADVQKPSANFFQVNPPLTAHTSVKNTGNTDFLATTTYRVSDVFGNQKHSQQVEYAVLPETTRATDLQWQESPAFGLFQVEIRTKALDKDVFTKAYVFMAPFWFYGIIAILVVGGIMYALAKRKQ